MLIIPLPLTGKPLPDGWVKLEEARDGAMWENQSRRLRVIASYHVEQDGHLWVHLSMSHRKRIPSYEELCYLKNHWLGEDRKAIMVFPEEKFKVNIHPRVLHLFSRMDGDSLPEFSWGMGTL